jgi:hypothetical protein
MSFEQDVRRASDAIRDATRCDDYYLEVGACDGLDGCEACLTAAARAALQAVEDQR